METLKQRFSFGKHKSLMSTPGGAMFNGRRLQQLTTFAVQCTMRDYILEKIDPIALPKKNKKSEGPQPAPECVSADKDQKEARPEVLGTTTYIASTKAEELTLTHLREAAKTVKHLKQIANMSLLLHSIPPDQVRIA
eukprot:2386211-Amphidinium_carterae.1